MKQHKKILGVLFTAVVLLAAGCGISDELPEVKLPDGAGETAEALVQTAGDKAKTAVSQAGDYAQTVAVVATEQGSSAVATLKAVGTPDLDGIKNKIASIQPDSDGKFSHSISAQDLNRILLLRQLITGPDSLSLIRNVAVEFKNGQIILGADISKPLETRVQFAFEPIVEEGALRFEIVDASATGADAPEEVLEAAASLLNGTLGEAVQHLPPALKLESVNVDQGVLTLAGGRDP